MIKPEDYCILSQNEVEKLLHSKLNEYDCTKCEHKDDCKGAFQKGFDENGNWNPLGLCCKKLIKNTFKHGSLVVKGSDEIEETSVNGSNTDKSEEQRKKLWDGFKSLENHLQVLSSIVQNQIGIDGEDWRCWINGVENFKSEFNTVVMNVKDYYRYKVGPAWCTGCRYDGAIDGQCGLGYKSAVECSYKHEKE